MSATIIQFAEASQSVIAKRTLTKQMDLNIESILRTSPSTNQEYSKKTRQILFDQEFKNLMDNLHTKHSEFMFPTILSGYRKYINPVDALYNNLQEVLFIYDSNQKFCVWIVELFKNLIWTDKLCAALDRDIRVITQFQESMFDPYSEIGKKEIIELERIKNKFAHYSEVFKLMKTWKAH